MTRADLERMAALLRHADVMVNFATTVTLECAIIDTPTLLVAFSPIDPEEMQRYVVDLHFKMHYQALVERDLVPVAWDRAAAGRRGSIATWTIRACIGRSAPRSCATGCSSPTAVRASDWATRCCGAGLRAAAAVVAAEQSRRRVRVGLIGPVPPAPGRGHGGVATHQDTAPGRRSRPPPDVQVRCWPRMSRTDMPTPAVPYSLVRPCGPARPAEFLAPR